jgi:predicted lipoprotein with Yx(FWY)xxD motif
MRKSGWAAATGLGSLVLLLAACGGSSSPTGATGAGSSSSQTGSGSSGPAAPASSVSAASTATKNGGGSSPGSSGSATPHHTAGPQPSAGISSIPPIGTTVMIVQHSAIGFVMAVASGQVVYTYSNDKKGGASTCTGTCAQTWLPVTGKPQAGPADTFPGSFAVVKDASGVYQVTYNGLPLYTLKGAKPYTVTGNNMGGVWHVIPLSASDIHT